MEVSGQDNNNTGALNGNNLNATQSGLGTFSFTYSLPQVGTCPAMQSTVFVTVYRAPVPGTSQGLVFCENDDFSAYTNVNLFGQLSGEDSNGLWSESGTSEFSGISDSTIDIQHLFDTHGAGTYNFTYTVFPTNPICIPKSASVTIEIKKILDFTGATLTINSDICENEIATATYTGTLTQGIMPIPNGSYEILCHIASTSTNGNVTIISPLNNGVMNFSLPSTLFQQVGAYTITIIDIHGQGANPCDNIINVSDVLNIFPSPKIDNAVISIDPICVGFRNFSTNDRYRKLA
ncbi:hypothetical protein [Flavobacterium sp. 3HN19-14]|uniref:hypothetical protein n=1 Tax=Flavobacterium sp. 3HN19-14 TaxID=3448133 RepID=UPI003EDFB835